MGSLREMRSAGMEYRAILNDMLSRQCRGTENRQHPHGCGGQDLIIAANIHLDQHGPNLPPSGLALHDTGLNTWKPTAFQATTVGKPLAPASRW